MDFVPTPTPAADTWSFHADRIGHWRWILSTPERVTVRESAEVYATRADAVKNAQRYGYRDPDTAISNSFSFPGLRRFPKK